MNFEKPARETLRYLFSAYLKGPSAIYPIIPVTKKYRLDAIKFSDYLLDNHWIRERWVYRNDIVACRITIRGIEQIDPAYVRQKLQQVIGGLGEAGGSRNLVDILEVKLEEYSISLDLVKQLESLGLIKICHPKNDIVIELTEQGKKYYEKGSRTFFTLMALA
jgi:hypothetical protein